MKQSVLSVALAGVVGAMSVGAAGDAAAMNYHLQRDRIVLSGGVTYADMVSLPALLEKAKAEGRPIREVVLRTSNGGSLAAGEWLQGVIRTAGLNTIVSGHCISSCSIMQSGGVERHLAGDLPIVDSVQIHAASLNGEVIHTPSARMAQIYAGNYGGGMDAALLHKALYDVEQPNGLLVFSDPSRTKGDSVSFDPDGSGDRRETFAGQDIHSNNIVTASGYRDPGDTLNVTADVTGDLNPGYLRTGQQLQAFVDADFARLRSDWESTYINLALRIYDASMDGADEIGVASVQDHLGDQGIRALLQSKLRLGELSASTLDDSMGVIRIGNAATWRTAATTGADIVLVDNGMIALEGGALRASQIDVSVPGMLVGHGDIAGTAVDLSALIHGTGPSWREDGFNRLRVSGTLMPRGGDLVTHGYVNIMPGGKVLFDITEDGGPASGRLRVGSFFDDLQRDGALVIADGAYLALNVAQGFYGQDFRRDLVEGPIHEAGFRDVVRLGDTGYTANLAAGDVFRPRHNSLLSFNVLQSATGLRLTANPGFDQPALFGNVASGDGLGHVLATAADNRHAALKPLLASLQFADRDVVRRQSGNLRGDGHATLRLADSALVGSIGNVVQQHQFALRSSGGDADGLAVRAAQAASAQTGVANGSLFNQLALHLAPAAGEGSGSATGTAGRTAGVWGRGFGSQGRIEGLDGVAGMTHTSGGIVLGADTRLADDRLTLGVSVAAADMSTKTDAGAAFSGDVRALDVGGYVDATYARGYLAFSARYTDLRHETRRSISGIHGLQAPLRATYSNDAVSARLEHGFSLTTGSGVVVQPLLPVVEYTRSSATRFDEGQQTGALRGHGDGMESLRVGAGLQLYKTFAGRNGERITPHARLVWQKELGDTRAQYNTAFSAAPELVFGTASQQLGEQVLAWNVGVTSRASEHLSIMLDYVGQRRDGQDQNGVMLGLGYRF